MSESSLSQSQNPEPKRQNNNKESVNLEQYNNDSR